MCLCVCTCVHVLCVGICTCVHVCILEYMHACIYICVYVCAYMRGFVCVSLCTRVCMCGVFVCGYMRVQACVYMYVHVCLYMWFLVYVCLSVCMCVCMCMYVCAHVEEEFPGKVVFPERSFCRRVQGWPRWLAGLWLGSQFCPVCGGGRNSENIAATLGLQSPLSNEARRAREAASTAGPARLTAGLEGGQEKAGRPACS